MRKLNKLTESFRDSLAALSEGWQDIWHRAKNAITRFTPASEEDATSGNRWGLISAEMQEHADGLTVSVEAPGMTHEDFQIFVSGQSLIIRGTKQANRTQNDGHYHITERTYGHFERIMPLPVEVDDSNTRASYHHGVLTLHLPRSERSRPRVISVT